MSDRPRSIKAAVVAAAGRVQPWAFGLLGAWLVGMSGDLLATLLAASTGFLGGLVGVLFATPEARLLPEADEDPEALPPGAGEASASSSARPLPEPLRHRFQELHKQVEQLLSTWPASGTRLLEKSALEAAPERFRALAKRLVVSHPDDPGRSALEDRLDRIEDHVERLRLHWSALDSLGEGEDGLEAELEATADDLDALVELQREIDER